jgi:eukaryotic-like serine/threonine-protein kinase
MPLATGERLGPYEIIAPLGAGGMGEVYKARDTRLDRVVAVKVSKQEFTERFEREARAVAALNHPHICQLYDVGPHYLVMEYVEGSTLKGPLALDKAVEYAAQIASALDAAHTHKVTHRDLKPGNVLVTKSAGVKLLDFGLAKIDKPFTADHTTVARGLTAQGSIVGTLLYMSPEQLNGLEADPRSDIFSFGLVLYEMITGSRAFEGATPASVIAAILERPAPSIADVAPPALDRVLKRCLEKDPENRWQTARDLRAALELATQPATPVAGRATVLPEPGLRRWLWPTLAVVATASALTLAVLHLREAPPSETRAVQFQIPPPGKSSIDYFKLSPDGQNLAFIADSRLWVRPLDSLQAQPLAGTEGANEMFWSPDSQSIAFVAQGKLQRMAASGGPAQTICNVSQSHGGTWNRDGVIVLPLSLTSGLFQVSANGGVPVPLGQANATGGVPPQQIQPEFLPDGRHFLYWELKREHTGIYVGSLDGMPPLRLFPQSNSSDSNAIYVPAAGATGQDGYLLFRRGETLMAQRFNPTRLSLSGDGFPIAERIGGSALWAAFSISENGTLVYASTGGVFAVQQLAWWDRNGKQMAPFGPPGIYQDFRLAPDEKRIAFSATRNNNADVWVLDSVRGVPSRLTFDPAIDDPPLWSPDGSRIVWASSRTGPFDLYVKSASGTGPEKLLIKMGTPAGWPEDWSQDGRYLLYQIPGATTGQDLWVAAQPSEDASEDRKPFPYLQAEFDEKHGRFYPNGRWVAYTSNESGRDEVYVQSFPLSGAKFQISADGGREPQWRKDGTELFYIAEDRTLMAVPVKLLESAPEPLQVGSPKRLFPMPFVDTFIVGLSYEVSRDGERFLMPASPSGAAAPPLTVILNWQTQLKN